MITILIIDEEKLALRAVIDAIKTRVICKIDFAENCSEGITQFLNNNYDHIILDLILPIGDYKIIKDIIADNGNLMFGLQLLKFFRKTNKLINIVGYSIADTEEIRQVFIDENANYLCKVAGNSLTELLKMMTTKSKCSTTSNML